MSSIFRLGALTLVIGACAPAQTAPVRPTPAAAPPAAPAPAPVPAPAPAVEGPPEHWWLLDPATDRVRGISVERAYRELLAGKQPRDTVVVAIIDSGIDTDHPDLRGNLWVNRDEVAGNDRDDDRNGYVDDVHGWNFIGGRDGRHVEHDTYELTRLYARLRPRFETARPDTLSAAAREEYQEYQKVKREFEAKRAETTELLGQVEAIQAAMERFTAMLKQHLGTDSLTVERVAAIRTIQPDLRRAQQVYLQMMEHGVTLETLRRDRETLQTQLRYNLNPEFNPRPLVGDDYADLSQRRYGNPDIEGPDASHGTHVAGIVGAVRGNRIGIEGIAPAVRIMAIRAVPDGDERDKDVANAIRYAVDNGAKIINMSFGKGYSPEKEAVDEAVRYAEQKGVLFIHAAGNEAVDLAAKPSFPTRTFRGGGAARNWIEVGASSWRMADSLVAPFSNYGREGVDVFAPGVDIRSTVPGGEYEAQSGTSMAAPVVTGLAALIMAYYPELTAEQVKRIILESATRYPEDQVLRPGGEGGRVRFGDLSATGGVVNAYAALRLAEQVAQQSRN